MLGPIGNEELHCFVLVAFLRLCVRRSFIFHAFSSVHSFDEFIRFLPISAVTSTCRKEQVREYYTENDCRSRQPLKYAKCVGGCGNQCCSATITRRRKVRMVCGNNAKYVKNLDIVRKCGCSKKCY